MDKKLIDELQSTIREAEKLENERPYLFFFSSALSNARGALSGILNPPKRNISKPVELNDKDLQRVIFLLKSAMVTENEIDKRAGRN